MLYETMGAHPHILNDKNNTLKKKKENQHLWDRQRTSPERDSKVRCEAGKAPVIDSKRVESFDTGNNQ